MLVAAFTAVCQADECWVDQYLAEARRLNMSFFMYFDRCSNELRQKVMSCSFCRGGYVQNNQDKEFNEMAKQHVLDKLVEHGYTWAMAWDIDETYEKDAPTKLLQLRNIKEDVLDTPWKNLWENKDTIRTDGPFASGHRVKFYNVVNNEFKFYHPTVNGPRSVYNNNPTTGKFDLVCLHWGMMTRELRMEHKKRWDRIYTAAVGSNPYGFWNYALDESVTITTVPNEYL